MNRLAVGLLAALLVYAFYYPADSVEVEHGRALYFCVGALLFGWAAWTARPAITSWRADRWSLLLDVSVWGLAGWMVIAALANASQINMRMAVNELWLWLAAAAIVTGMRRSVLASATRDAIVFLLIAAGVALAVHGWHQLEVSLPADQARFEADPEGVLIDLGIHPSESPPGSAQRMNIRNRLYDGGPTATFALANSLAAALLFGWVLAFGVLLRHRGSDRKGRSATEWWFLTIAVAAVAMIGWMLLRSHSRSAVGSGVLAACGLLVYEFGGGRLDAGWRRLTGATNWKKKLAAAVVGFLLLVVVGGLWIASRGELLERALPSLMFRLQYWRSTLALAWDAPWFGCSPGNFQAFYENYRDISASEQIADPHNWLMETLAAGGFPAAALLGLVIISLVKLNARQGTQLTANASSERLADDGAAEGGNGAGEASPEKVVPSPHDDLSAAVWMGAAFGLFAVWVLGAFVGSIPDLEAHLFAVPIAGLVLVGFWQCRPSGLELRGAIVVALMAVMLHLSFSGGWTVPGVIFPVWILAASLVPVSGGGRAGERGSVRQTVSPDRLAALLVGGVLLFLLQKTAMTPSQRLAVETHHASEALARGRIDDAISAFQRAAESDPWNPSPVRDSAALQVTKLLEIRGDELPSAGPERPAVVQMFETLDQIEQEALRRAPRDPALWRHFGKQRLHLYQRWGRPEDLETALHRLERGFEFAPAHETVAAQIALIEQRQGKIEEAQRWARRAQRLAEAGGHIERQLDRIVVLIPDKLGAVVRQQPRQVVASVALANLLGD